MPDYRFCSSASEHSEKADILEGVSLSVFSFQSEADLQANSRLRDWKVPPINLNSPCDVGNPFQTLFFWQERIPTSAERLFNVGSLISFEIDLPAITCYRIFVVGGQFIGRKLLAACYASALKCRPTSFVLRWYPGSPQLV